MNKLILIFFLLTSIALAGTEILDPDGDIRMESDWVSVGCSGVEYNCMSDDVDANQVYIYDNNTVGAEHWYTFGDPTTSTDSIPDSLGFVLRSKSSHVNCSPAIVDSISGYDNRTSSNITLIGDDGAWEQDTVWYSTSPAGGEWTWTQINGLCAGVQAATMQNNRYLYTTELWVIVAFSAPSEEEAALTDNIHDPSGAGMVHSPSGSSKRNGP
jgi:hypothetical protein